MQYFALTSRSIVLLALMQICFIVGSVLVAALKIKFYNYPSASPIKILYSYGYYLMLIPLFIAGIVSFLSNSRESSEKAASVWSSIYILFVFLFFVMFICSMIY